jgi:ribose-phosphate pyrophosphokinase
MNDHDRLLRKAGIVLIAGDAHPQLADEIARLAGAVPIRASVSAFADGETRVRIDADVQDADTYIVQPTCTPTNERLMTLALMADAARCAGAARITAVLPYFGYARQDVMNTPGESRSAQFAARLLRTAGIDRTVVVDLHSPALESAFEMPLVHLRADELMVPVVREWGVSDLTIVSPDAGGLKRAQRYASMLAAPVAVVAKTRPAPDMAAALHVLGDVRGRSCLLVDDMASTGRTLVGAAEALMQAGAGEIHALFIHAVMAPGALERIRASPVRHIVTTDSVPSAAGAKLQVVSVAPLLAGAVKRLAGRE